MKNTQTKLKAKFLVAGVIAFFALSALSFINPNTAAADYATPGCTTATLHGTVTPNGASTQVWFDWGLGNTLSHSTSTQNFSSNSDFSAQITGLTENTMYSYRAMASNQNGTATGQTRTFTTNDCTPVQNPTVNLTASPSSIQSGQGSVLTWNSTNATSCSAIWTTSNATSGSKTVFPTNTTTYSITCSNSTGSASDSATVNVTSQNPTVNLTASPSSIQAGQGSVLSWNSQNATSCSAPWTNSNATSGSVTVFPNSTTTYSITCSNGSGSASDSATVNVQVQNQPTVNITADDTSIDSGDSTVVRWNSDNATSCSASGGTNGWSGSKPLDGSFNTGSLTSDKTYTITCSNNFGSANDSVTINVDEDNNDDVTVDIRADDTSIDFGDSTIVRWNSDNADSCKGTGGDNGWSGSKPLNGSFNTGSLEDTTTYKIICENDNSSAEDDDSVTVHVSDDDDNNDEAPDVTTKNATNVTIGSATLNGRVDGNGSSVRAWFEYGPNTNLGFNTSQNSYGSGSTDYSRGVTGLSANTTYYFRAVAENSTDTVYGNILSFTTGNNIINPPVNNQPSVVVSADSTNIAYNSSTTIRWSSINATSCFASGGSVGWAGTKSIGPGSFFTGSLTGSRTYTITCSNNVGSDTDSVTVNVRGQVLGVATAPTSLVLVTSSVDRNQPIVPTLDNTNPCPGDDINYTITYQNIGTGSITNLVLRIDLPLEVDYISSNPSNPSRSGNTLIFNLGSLRANGQGTVTVKVHVRDNISGGANLNFPAVLSYIDPSGFPQSVNANVSAGVCSEPEVVVSSALGANVFGAGFLPTSIFGWLLLLILILILVLLAKYLFGQPFQRKTITTYQEPLGQKTTTTTIHQ